MGYKPTRRTVVASSGLVAAGLAGCMGSSEHEDDDDENGDDGGGGDDGGDGGSSNNPNNRTVEWQGQGDEFAEQDCPGQFGYWKWILTPGGQPPIAPEPVPELTVTYEEQGQLDPVEGELRPGGAGAVQFDVFKEDGDTVESAFVEFSGGGPNARLVISEGSCVDDPEPPNLIEVATLDATAVNGESATLQGELIELGPFGEVDLFFRWKHVEDVDFTTVEAEPPTLTEPGSFSATITGLGPGNYEFQAVAIGDNDQEITATGDIFAFEKKEPDEKKQPDVKKDTTLKAVCYEEKEKKGKDGKKYEKKVKFVVKNDTGHDVKYSWKAKGTEQGGKLTVPKKDQKYFWVKAGKEPLKVALSFDGKTIHTANTKDADESCEKE